MLARQQPLYELVKAGSDLEELLVLDATMADVASSMLTRMSGMPAALTTMLKPLDFDPDKTTAAVTAVMTKVGLLAFLRVSMVTSKLQGLSFSQESKVQ
jgi:hypothetical protein